MIKINNHKKYTVYCGLYCLDCIPSNNRLFKILDKLENLLEDIKFEVYAELKSKPNETFNDPAKLRFVARKIEDFSTVS